MISRFDLLICLFIITTLSGCKKIDLPTEETKPGEQQVTLRLVLPQSNNKAGTYAISAVDQNSIQGLDVLAFRVTDNGKEYYAYHRQAVLLRPDQGGTAVDFHVDLLKSTDKFRFVLIANAEAKVKSALSGLSANAEKETVMSRIEYGITTKWNAGSLGNFTPLPMWGESITVDGINNNTQKFSVNMLRSMAAIDVQVTANDFVMTEVLVYNQSNKGRMAPSPQYYDGGERIVTAPSIPAGTNRLATQRYTATNTLAGEIFLFESAAATSIGDPNATGLVIAGKYAGSTVVTYYRLELTDSLGNLTPVLRNHRYVVNITKVHSPGFTGETQAWASKPMGMTASVTAWSEISTSETSVHPVYYLEVSDDQRDLGGFEYEFPFSVRTNLPGGHTLEGIPSGLQITNTQIVDDKTIYTFKVSANPNYNNSWRRLQFTVNATMANGKPIEKKIVMRQHGKPVDIGFSFLVSAENVNRLFMVDSWFHMANVTYGDFSPSAPQKTGIPYPQSCAAFGPRYRLPTLGELQSLAPNNNDTRRYINAELLSRGASRMYTTFPGYSAFVSSTSAGGQNFSTMSVQNGTVGGTNQSEDGKINGNPAVSKLGPFGINYLMRCVASK